MENLFEGIDLELQLDVDTAPATANNLGDESINVDSGKDSSTEKPEDKTATNLIDIPDGITDDEVELIEKKIKKETKPPKKEIDNEEETVVTHQETPSLDKDHDSSPIITFAKALSEEGLIDEIVETDFTETEDKVAVLFNYVEKKIQSEVRNVEESYPPRLKKALEALKAGVPEDEVFDNIETEISYASIDETLLEEKEDWQEELLRQRLRLQGMNEEEIEEEVNDAKDLGKLYNKAKSSLQVLVKHQDSILKTKAEEAKKQQEAAIEQQNKLREEYVSFVNSLEEVIPGQKLTKAIKDKMVESMTKPIAKDKQGNPQTLLQQIRAKDPKKFDATFQYLLVTGAFEGKWDGLVKTAEKKAITKLKESLNDTSYHAGSSPNQRGNSTAQANLDAMRNLFNK